MKCQEFKDWLERENPKPPLSMPQDAAEHHSSCPDCQSLLKEEIFWQRFFAATREPSLSRSLWPGVKAGIEEELVRENSFSAMLVVLCRRLSLPLALLVLLLGGGVLWQQPAAEPEDPTYSFIAVVEDPAEAGRPLDDDSILELWLAAGQV